MTASLSIIAMHLKEILTHTFNTIPKIILEGEGERIKYLNNEDGEEHLLKKFVFRTIAAEIK